ncbi:MAG TPA: hypothetical protein VMW19_19180, partial [Myxococcota bacterium]|nr:hypothetical protein [Myxococcota bacterium]
RAAGADVFTFCILLSSAAATARFWSDFGAGPRRVEAAGAVSFFALFFAGAGFRAGAFFGLDFFFTVFLVGLIPRPRHR